MLFMPDLLKPAQIEITALLFSLYHGEFPESGPPPAGRVAIDHVEGVSDNYWQATGYRRIGGRVMRVDMAERLAAVIRTESRKGIFRITEEMLSLARNHAGHLAGIEFMQGSTDALLASGAAADAVIANMVLHHAPNPRGILADAANLLTPSGTLIVSELCAHDQAWAREHCGDLWLGFMPDELAEWATEAGLKLEASVFLAQRNGFQIQVQHFQRC